jgi:AcrR family transcriptional regulator
MMSGEPSAVVQKVDSAQNAPRQKSRAKPVGASPKGAARREEILSGLMQKIARQELRNPSLREIGRALNIEPAHILYYFGSREALLQSVIMRWDDDARASSPDSVVTLDNFAEQLKRNIAIPGVVHLYLNFAAEAVDPDHPAHEFFKQRFDRVAATLATRIREEQARGAIRPETDPESTARQLIAMADGLQLQSLVNPNVNALQFMVDAIASLRR